MSLDEILEREDVPIDVKEKIRIELSKRKHEKEAVVQESEERYRKFAESLPGIVFEMDLTGKLTFINNAAIEKTGYTRQQFEKGMSAFSIIAEKDKERMLTSLARIGAGKEMPSEYEVVKSDRSTFHGLFNTTAILTEGKLTGFLGFITDITERKEWEKKLMESEEKNRLLFDDSPIEAIVVDIEGRIINYNKTFISAAEKRGQRLPKIRDKLYVDYGSKHAIDMRAELMDCIRSKTIKSFNEMPYRSRFLDISMGSTLNGAIISAIDITERKKAQKTLSDIIDFLPDATFVIDMEGKVIAWNRAIEEMTGVNKKNILGQNNFIYSLPFYGERRKLLADMVIAKDIKLESEYKVLYKKGNTIFAEAYTPSLHGGKGAHVLAMAAPLFDETGKHIGAIESIRDITKYKWFEEQLQIRQRMDSLGTLAGGICHDFNNLLAGIIGYLSLAGMDKSLSHPLKGYIEKAQNSSERAGELIKQLQKLSTNAVSEKTDVDLYSIADDVFNLLKSTTNKIIDKRLELRKEEFYVKGVASELHQVLLNLGTNSVLAIEEKGAKNSDYIKIRASEYKSHESDKIGLIKGDYVHIFFEDTGIGMQDEVSKRVFDPLFSTRAKSGQKGQGLGLAMVYNIITRTHNGYIGIESSEGKGTTMHLYLPRATPPLEKAIEKAAAEAYDGNETILLIDDEELLQEFVKDALTMYGYKVHTANNGRQGLDIYTANQASIDLVVLDMTMPEMSGQAVLENLLKINENVKVLISSGQSSEKLQDEVMSKAKGYLNKPYTIEKLGKSVRTVLDMK